MKILRGFFENMMMTKTQTMDRICCDSKNDMKVAPLTILYDGRMEIFDVTNDKAEDIIKFAEKSKNLSLVRRNSLLRFMEKRKERLCWGSENGTKLVSLTILYDGRVADFCISSDKVEDILMFAKSPKLRDTISLKQQLFMEALSGDIPLARKNSLLRFLEKRKERLCVDSENGTKSMPRSTLCNGALAVFYVNDKAEDILNSVESFNVRDVFSSKNKLLVETSGGDLPLARRNSVVRFLNQRKERRMVIFDVTNDKAEDILKFAEK